MKLLQVNSVQKAELKEHGFQYDQNFDRAVAYLNPASTSTELKFFQQDNRDLYQFKNLKKVSKQADPLQPMRKGYQILVDLEVILMI